MRFCNENPTAANTTATEGGAGLQSPPYSAVPKSSKCLNNPPVTPNSSTISSLSKEGANINEQSSKAGDEEEEEDDDDEDQDKKKKH
ncbi:hypothetical protein PVK06_029005 [Gossypium arboreum]|uniref:Uncharacterized protein n=1 Tax=Gossypium arboreum TaxID=29729 RepID=A0ABR0P5F0_GOSAR|nr:hypothetical protein PVK06_029005 [Gossypium arboreum]